MTIPATASEISYAGDNTSTVFPVPFAFGTSADLRVVLTDPGGAAAVLTSGFSVSGGSGSTGSLTLEDPLATGYKLTIIDDPELSQDVDYLSNDAFPAETHEFALDKLTRLVKRMSRQVMRSARIQDGETPLDPLPPAASRADQFLMFDSFGRPDASGLPVISRAGRLMAFDQSGRPTTLPVVVPGPGLAPGAYVNVKDFGAKGDGSTDDTDAVQKAADWAAVANIALYLPVGTYVVTEPIGLSNAVRVIGDGAVIDAAGLSYDKNARGSGAVFRFVSGASLISTALSASASAGDQTITVDDAIGIQVGDLIRCISDKVQYRNGSAIAYFNDQNRVTAISGSDISLETPLSYPLDITSNTVAVQAITPISGARVSGITFIGGGVTESLDNSMGRVGVWGYGVADFEVSECSFYNFQGIAVGVDRFADVRVSDCYIEGAPFGTSIVEGQNSGFYGVLLYRGRRATLARCTGIRVRHLLDGQEVYTMSQESSKAVDTHRAAFGSHEEVYDLLISGCQTDHCETSVVLRALTAAVRNSAFRGGYSSMITAANMTAGEAGARWTIEGCELVNDYAPNGAIVLSTSVIDRLVIRNNEISNPPGFGIRLTPRVLKNTVISGNTVDGAQGIVIAGTVLDKLEGLVVQGNFCFDYTVNAIRLDGALNPSAPAEWIKILDNTGIPVSQSSGSAIHFTGNGWFGDHVVARGNSQFGDNSRAVTVSDASRFMSFPVTELNDENIKRNQGGRSIGNYTTSSAPSNATLLRGQVLERANINTGVSIYWQVTSDGTEGSISGVTADISASSTTATLVNNDATKVYPGSYIIIAGAGVAAGDLTARVISLSDDFATAELDTAASTTVAGAAVSRRNPTITAGPDMS